MRDEGAGPAVLLLHAFPCDSSLWDGQVGAITAAGFRVLVPDLPGFGSSPLPTDPPELDHVAVALAEALDERGIERFALAGLSLGGYLAMALLRRIPERITALMLVDTKAVTDPEPARQNRLAVADRVVSEKSTEFLVEAMLPALLGQTSRSDRPDVVRQVKAWIRNAAPQTVAWYQRAMARRPDSLVDLQHFAGPALVVYGEQDTVLSPYSEQLTMVEALPDAQLAAVAAAGHLSAAEQPEAVAGLMVEFLRSASR